MAPVRYQSIGKNGTRSILGFRVWLSVSDENLGLGIEVGA